MASAAFDQYTAWQQLQSASEQTRRSADLQWRAYTLGETMATGSSANLGRYVATVSCQNSGVGATAVDRIKKTSPRSIRFACLVTCPQGLKTFHGAHPDVPVYTPSVDRGLNSHGYIVPGLGDAGDRIFGTK